MKNEIDFKLNFERAKEDLKSYLDETTIETFEVERANVDYVSKEVTKVIL